MKFSVGSVLNSSKGFTLIELLVVMAIMAVVGFFTLANYKSFGEDQNLKNAVLDVVSLLRQAQTNATTNVICEGGSWQGLFLSSTSVRLKCSNSSNGQRDLLLNKNNSNISISLSSGDFCALTTVPSTINFAALSGDIYFNSYPNCASLTINLTNGNSSRSLKIDKGGRIDAQ